MFVPRLSYVTGRPSLARLVLVAAATLFSWSASAATYFVTTNGNDVAAGTNWATAKLTIQAAVDASATGDRVVVSNGVYATGGSVYWFYALTNRVLIDKVITVESLNGPDVTIIAGNPVIGVEAVRCVYITTNATLSGFTLTNGATRVLNVGFALDQVGGGVFCGDSGAVVTNCILAGNQAGASGGGAYDGTLNNCTLTGNHSYFGGGASEGMLNYCTLTDNTSTWGGGVAFATLNHGLLSGNSSTYNGGGAYESTMNNCTLTGNHAGQSGGAMVDSTANNCLVMNNTAAVEGGGTHQGVLNNCLFTGNSASFYGGASSYSELNNCTLTGNSAVYGGGGAYYGTLKNCIVYSNEASSNFNHANATFSHSCTTPLPAGPGNITNNPLFVATNNFRLSSASPCINAGSNALVVGTADLSGTTRIIDGTVDMGAYEFHAGPGVLTRPASDLAALGTTLNGTVNPDAAASEWYFDYGLTTNYGSATPSSQLAAGTNAIAVSIPVSGLLANTLYHFRIVATNSGGVTEGADLSFTTAVATAPVVVTLPATGVTAQAVSLNGTIQPGGVPTDYFFEYGVSTNYGDTTATVSLAPGTNVVAVSLGISGLLPGTLYHVRLMATNNVGAASGVDLTFTTPALPPEVVTAPASEVTAHAATLNGTVNPGGAATDYYFAYGVSTNYGSATITNQLTAGTDVVAVSNVLSGLLPGALYHIRLVATNSAGTDLGADFMFTTPAVLPVAVTELASEVTTNSATLNGTVNPGGAASGYYFDYGLTTNYGSATPTGQLVAGTDVIAVSNGISGLLPGTLYHVRLTATNSAGVAVGVDLTFTTPALLPVAVTVPAGAVTTNAATFYGTVDPGGAATDYYFEYGVTTNYGSATVTNQLTQGYAPVAVSNMISGLSENTVYHFRLVAINSAGTTQGEDLSFTTPPVTVTVLANGGTASGGGNYFPGTPVVISATGDSSHWIFAGWNDGEMNLSRTITVLPTNITYTATFTEAVGAVTAYVAITSTNPVWPYASWATAATNIQDAVDVLLDGDIVVVSNGVYDTGGRVLPFLALTNRLVIDKAITVRSVNGPSVTTIQGSTTNQGGAARCVYAGANASLVGFTLSGGSTLPDTASFEDFIGGGISCEAGVVVSNCIVSGNTAEYGGGSHGGTLNHCTVSGNTAAYGGGSYGGTLNDCRLIGNTGVQGGGTLSSTLNRCRLVGNAAVNTGGGAWLATLNDCILINNTSESSGGGAADSSLNNCTIVQNAAAIFAGGTYRGTLKNCILYFNTAPSGPNYESTAFTNSCTTPLPPSGTGNITNDPQLVDAVNSNLHLSATSPCHDTGNNVFAPGGIDFDGNTRIVNTIVDMGAYEYQGADITDSDTDGSFDADELIAGTNPSDATSFWKVDGPMSASSVSFNSVTGRLYAVDRNDALLAVPQIWIEFTNNIPGTGNPIAITDPLPGTNRSYRVRVQLP